MIELGQFRRQYSEERFCFLHQPGRIRVRIHQRLRSRLIRSRKIEGFVDDFRVERRSENIFNVSFLQTENRSEVQKTFTFQHLVLPQRLEFLFVGLRVVAQRGDIQFLAGEQRYERLNLIDAASGAERPATVEHSAFTPSQCRRPRLQVQNVAGSFDQQRVLADEQRLCDLVSECALQRKQRVAICRQGVVANLCTFGCPLTRLRLEHAVFNNANSGQVVSRNHKRRVSCVDDLVSWSKLFIKIPQQVFLGFPVQRQARLVQQQNQIAIGFLDLSKFHQEREEPDKASAAFRERQR